MRSLPALHLAALSIVTMAAMSTTAQTPAPAPVSVTPPTSPTIGIAAFNIVSMLVMVVNDKRTDIAILRAIQAHRSCLWTSEPAVRARTGIPLLPIDG